MKRRHTSSQMSLKWSLLEHFNEPVPNPAIIFLLRILSITPGLMVRDDLDTRQYYTHSRPNSTRGISMHRRTDGRSLTYFTIVLLLWKPGRDRFRYVRSDLTHGTIGNTRIPKRSAGIIRDTQPLVLKHLQSIQ